jgi:hypothetical protein
VSWSFTAHFAALEPGAGSAGAEPADAAAVRADLRRALEAELRRHGLWAASPSYVGVVGHRRWDRDALDELAADCYLHQLARLRGLKAQLAAGAVIDGFVLLNVRHFVFERQRANDPLGYRVFEMLERALERAGEGGRLLRPAPRERVRNDTVVAFAPDGAGAAAGGAEAAPAAPEALAPLARRFGDDLLPALVTARGRAAREAVVSRLVEHLATLPRLGHAAFRFGDLAAPLKDEVRRRWAALGGPDDGATAFEGEGDLAVLVRTVPPDGAVEERHRFEKLLECAAERCAGLSEGDGAGEMLSLLAALARHARDPAADEPPSHRALARETAIPRHKLPALCARLGEVIAACERAIDTPRTVNDRGRPAAAETIEAASARRRELPSGGGS